MLKSLKYLIAALMLMLSVSCNRQNDNQDVIHFTESMTYRQKTVPCVTFKIDKTKCTFILDTGSEISIINENFYKKHTSAFEIADSVDLNINTISGVGEASTYVCNTYLNDSITASLYVMDINHVSRQIFTEDGILIDGILGCDFLYRHKIIINFENKTIFNNDSIR